MTASYEIDHSHSSIEFSVRHLMIAKVRGQFARWQAELKIDDADPTKSEVRVDIDAASVETRDGKRDEHLRSADFLDVANHPTLTYRSARVTKVDDGRYAVDGELTIRGVTRPVRLDVEAAGTVRDPWGGLRTGYSARTSIRRSEFGLTWNVVLEAGGLTVGDQVEIAIEIEAKAMQAAA